MAAFDTAGNMQGALDPAMDNCSGPILYDVSSDQEMIYSVNPISGASQVGGAGPACFQSQSNTKLIAATDRGARTRFDKSYLKIEYEAMDISVPAPYQPIDPNHVSIPWNPIAALIQSAYYQINSTNQTMEKLELNFQHGNMVKLLTSYSGSALESADDRFFTPCIEEVRDLRTAFSQTTITRAQRNLVQDGGVAIQHGSKCIMLSDLFDSLKTETASFVLQFTLTITFFTPDQILMEDSAATGTNRFYITGLKLYLVQDIISITQTQVDSEKIGSPVALTRNAFLKFETTRDAHSPSKKYVYSNVMNMQGAVFMVSSRDSGDGLGANPYQYCYDSTAVLDTGITSYQHRYGKIFSPAEALNIDPKNKAANIDLYENWRILSRMINDKTFSPAITFYTAMGRHSPICDISPYVFFAATFFNKDAAPQKLPQGQDHTVTIGNGAPCAGGINVRIRLCAYAIYGNLQAAVLD